MPTDGEWSFNVAATGVGLTAEGDLVISSTSCNTVRVGNFSADGNGLVVQDSAMTANLPTAFSCNVTVAGLVLVGAVGAGGCNALSYVSGTAGVDGTTQCHLWYSSNATVGPLLTLDAIGTLTSKGEMHMYSDARVKTDLRVIGGALDRVRALHGYTFARLDNPSSNQRRFTGLLAQDVQRVLPEAVGGGRDGTGESGGSDGGDEPMLSVSYGALSGMFVEAFKELADRQDHLDRMVASLRGRHHSLY